MKPISFSYVNTRKRALQCNPVNQKISFRTVNENLNPKNLLTFIESGCIDNADTHFMQSMSLYNKLVSECDLSEKDKEKILKSSKLILGKVKNLDTAAKSVSDSIIDDCDKEKFFDSLNILENCDRVIRNESKLLKRFDFGKIINQNIMRGTHHTVFEMCSLLDTYQMSSKAKMNIALENVSYALYKSGHKINLNEVTEYIVEYFLTRDTILTDKEFKGYTDVLKNNSFIDNESENISYVFKARDEYGSSFTDITTELAKQCENVNHTNHIMRIISIKNENQASEYIDATIPMIISDSVSKNDSLLLLKSIYCLPLIGNIGKEFIDYKLEMSEKKLEIKKKLTGIDNEKIIRDVLDNSEILEVAKFVSESVHFENYILDDHYIDETDPIKLLESEGNSDSENIKKIIDTFKASNEKSTSKFKNMVSRIMVKSPENIIEATPNLFATARYMLYLGVAASNPLGPIFAAILALVNKLLTTHLDLKQAEKLLKHLNSEKEKAEKKLEKLSGKEKENQEEYIKCLKDCISKTKSFISNIDDENEELNSDSDDDFDFGDMDFNFESAITESGSIIEFSAAREVLNELAESLDKEILVNIAPLFDNCSTAISDDFYKLVENTMNESKDKILVETCKLVLENKGSERISDEPNFLVQCEAELALHEVVKKSKDKKKKGSGLDLPTLKMALLNFKKKFRDLKGKEQELWRNIDISTSRITTGIQQALTSDRREAIIKGSIIPSFSKCIKSAIAIGGVGFFTGPVGAIITAVGMFAASKHLNDRERRLIYDEIDTELQVVEKQIQLAENEGNMNQYRFLLNYQKKLTREKHRIKYGIHMTGRTIPEIRKGNE